MKDRVRKDEITNIYCPTEIMVTDYFTKPLQGSLVVKILHIIIGYSHPSTLLKKSSSSDKERIEISTNLATSDDVLNSKTNNETQVVNIEYPSVPRIKPGTLANDIVYKF